MTPGLQETIDRVVDGELSDGEQVDLLRQLDSAPDGWRRLALAYVEAQTWGRDFRKVVHTATPTAASAGERACRQPPAPIGVRRFVLTVACATALGVGSVLTWQHFRAPLHTVAQMPDRNVERPVATAVDDRAVPAVMDNPRSTVRVRSTSLAGTPREVEVPLVNASQVNPDWLHSHGMLPADVRADLHHAGHDVEEVRHLIPFELDDGRFGVVPVDEIRFVNRRDFQ